MIAPDTNVLVRLLVVDDAAQTARASSLFEQSDILILKTVLLEAEWVLRSRYVLERDHIATFFRNLAETEGVGMEHEDACRAAVAAYARGMGFADALHAASAAAMNISFHTFDAAAVRYAVVIEQAETNFSAYVLDLPGCVATGETAEDANKAIREAIEFHLEGMRQDETPIPLPSSRVDYVEVVA